MQSLFQNEEVLKDCKIYQMLRAHAKEHLSFHTPGHKHGEWDITELSYSDNLSCPRGCIAEAEQDITRILGSGKSFIVTDGSTCGVLSMLYAAKRLGVQTVAFAKDSHKSVYNGCKLLQLTPLVFETESYGTMSALNFENEPVLQQADALLITSPTYYGEVAPLARLKEFCKKYNKLLLVDGAHGGHLHYDEELYAGAYADMWVDGVHKSLPAFTQGAVVSAKTEKLAQALEEGVDVFRTTSPSYPIMASVEYAVKYPRNEELEKTVKEYVTRQARIRVAQDWTKLCAEFGENAFEAEKRLEAEGIYPEFCDGNVIMFYLSPATPMQDFERLTKRLETLFMEYPVQKQDKPVHTPIVLGKSGTVAWVELRQAIGCSCAATCGLFPPCTPLFQVGERVTAEKVALLEKADNVFGIKNGKMAVFTADEVTI